jgi:hypothetical protein
MDKLVSDQTIIGNGLELTGKHATPVYPESFISNSQFSSGIKLL